jgi:prepilin-type N-terminal cleavage/methylation domain-containing protein
VVDPKSAPRARERGFSLIELMVVVVIIGLMAALAVPSMRIATFDRHAFDDAGYIMQLFRAARTRSIARGSAVLVYMHSSAQTDRGTFMMYEAVQGPAPANGAPNPNAALMAGAPVGACKLPTVWPNLPVAGATDPSPTVRFVDGVNLNGTPEVDADIETKIEVPPSNPVSTQVTTQFLCYTPLGRSYAAQTSPPVFAAANLNPIEVLVQRFAAGGSTTGGRSVIVLPNGSARIFSHVL